MGEARRKGIDLEMKIGSRDEEVDRDGAGLKQY